MKKLFLLLILAGLCYGEQEVLILRYLNPRLREVQIDGVVYWEIYVYDPEKKENVWRIFKE